MTELISIINNTIVKYAGVSNLLTIVVTILGAIYITGRLNRTKLERIKFDLEQKYASALFDKRVETYPSLSAIICGYQKIMLSKKNDGNNFCVFLEMLDNWHTKNSLFFSRVTAKFSEMSRLYFRYLTKNLDNQNESGSHGKVENKLSEDDWKDIYQILGDFELVLRADIITPQESRPGKTDEVKKVVEALENKIRNLPEKIDPFSS